MTTHGPTAQQMNAAVLQEQQAYDEMRALIPGPSVVAADARFAAAPARLLD